MTADSGAMGAGSVASSCWPCWSAPPSAGRATWVRPLARSPRRPDPALWPDDRRGWTWRRASSQSSSRRRRGPGSPAARGPSPGPAAPRGHRASARGRARSTAGPISSPATSRASPSPSDSKAVRCPPTGWQGWWRCRPGRCSTGTTRACPTAISGPRRSWLTRPGGPSWSISAQPGVGRPGPGAGRTGDCGGCCLHVAGAGTGHGPHGRGACRRLWPRCPAPGGADGETARAGDPGGRSRGGSRIAGSTPGAHETDQLAAREDRPGGAVPPPTPPTGSPTAAALAADLRSYLARRRGRFAGLRGWTWPR